MMKLFKRRSKVITLQIDEDKCTGCGNCVIRCRRNVFTLMSDQDQYVALVISAENCKGCSHCLEVCKAKAIELIKK